jgi:benzoylformate decarboxylase
MAATRSGAELAQDFIAAFGIEYVFGSPGTTETTFLAALAGSSATYVLARKEPSAVGIAAGYALATGKTAMVSLHTYPGLASGMFNLRNAYLSGVPLFVVNGTEDSRFLVHNPVLGGPNTQLAETATKYQYEVRTVDELTVAMQRCWVQAGLQPTGPVFLWVPMDFMQCSTDRIEFKSTQVFDDTASASIAQVAELLRTSGKLPIIVDYAVGWDHAAPALRNVAVTLGRRRVRRALPRAGRVRHASLHVQRLPPADDEGSTRDPLALRHRAPARREDRHVHHTGDQAVPPELRLIQITPATDQLGFDWPAMSPSSATPGRASTASLGWAMPLSVGLSLGTGRPSVCFVGGSLFSVHVIWTAPALRIPVVLVCFVNRETAS